MRTSGCGSDHPRLPESFRRVARCVEAYGAEDRGRDARSLVPSRAATVSRNCAERNDSTNNSSYFVSVEMLTI